MPVFEHLVSPDGTVGTLGGEALLEEASHWGWALRFYSQFYSCSVSFVQVKCDRYFLAARPIRLPAGLPFPCLLSRHSVMQPEKSNYCSASH